MTARYSVFDFLMELGEYFAKVSDFHKHDLSDVYRIIYEYASQQYPDDNILREMIAIDYYLQHNIRPADIFNVSLSKEITNQVIEQYQLNHHQYRFVMLPVSFTWDSWVMDQQIKSQSTLLVIQNDGKSKPVTLTPTTMTTKRTMTTS